MLFDICDTDTANLVGSFRDEYEALAMMRRAVGADGREAVASWALAPTGLSSRAISGPELVERAPRRVA